jgi:hypothetical protein
MMQYLGMWQIRVALVGLVLIGSFTAGWKVNGWRYEAQLKEQQDEYVAALKENDLRARKLADELQAQKAANQNLTDKLKGKINHVTDNRVCFDNWDAVQLWNEALHGKSDVSSTSTGINGSTRGTAAVTDRDLLQNQVENARRWKNLRDQVNKLREWEKQTFGDN